MRILGRKAANTARTDGWDSPRFLELFLNYGSFAFSNLVLPGRRYREPFGGFRFSITEKRE